MVGVRRRGGRGERDREGGREEGGREGGRGEGEKEGEGRRESKGESFSWCRQSTEQFVCHQYEWRDGECES